jgi:hypothetical protein
MLEEMHSIIPEKVEAPPPLTVRTLPVDEQVIALQVTLVLTPNEPEIVKPLEFITHFVVFITSTRATTIYNYFRTVTCKSSSSICL